MNGASHSTALKARTGELTPPGISCSARSRSRRLSSSLRAMLLLWSLCDYESINISSGDESEQRSSRTMVLSTLDVSRGQSSPRVTTKDYLCSGLRLAFVQFAD